MELFVQHLRLLFAGVAVALLAAALIYAGVKALADKVRTLSIWRLPPMVSQSKQNWRIGMKYLFLMTIGLIFQLQAANVKWNLPITMEHRWEETYHFAWLDPYLDIQ